MSNKLLIITAIIGCCIFNINAQVRSVEINHAICGKYNPSLINVEAFYSALNYDSLKFIYGREYKMVYPPQRPTPFFNSCICKGSVFCRGDEYSNLYLLYNIQKDELIVKTEKVNPTSTYIQLKKSNIDSFYIQSNEMNITLVNKKFPQQFSHIVPDGFYETLHNGNMKLYLKHKVIINTNNGYDDFKFLRNLIIFKNGSYYNVNKKRRLLKLFLNKKKEIHKKISSYHCSYKNLTRDQLKDLILFIEKTPLKSTI